MKFTPRTAQSIAKSVADFKLKPFQFPDGFGISIDTREQESIFGTRIPKGLVVHSKTLIDADYSITGMEDRFAVEKKQISDLISYCTSEREKTKRKLLRFSKMEWVGLMVVVGRESELYQPYQYSNVSPEVIRQSLVSFSVRWGLHIYVGNRENCCRFLLDHAIKFWKIKKEL
jgi:ERCC4-type nuclease